VAYEWVPAGALVYLDWCMTSLLVYLEAKWSEQDCSFSVYRMAL
jgi:hypothetical protein